jgi:hypothetical protein
MHVYLNELGYYFFLQKQYFKRFGGGLSKYFFVVLSFLQQIKKIKHLKDMYVSVINFTLTTNKNALVFYVITRK